MKGDITWRDARDRKRTPEATRPLRRRTIGVIVMAATALCGAEERALRGDVGSAIDWHLGLTQVYQQNVRGGLSRSVREGRYAGSYDLESTLDLSSAAGLKNTEVFVLVEGGWPESGGIDPASVGSYFGVNADAIEGQWGQLSELWVEHKLAEGGVLIRAGKLDLTGGFEHPGNDVAFDGSWYANDETSQFLNGALVNNPTIPFPLWTVGAAASACLSKSGHVGLGVAARDSDKAGDEFATWGSGGNGLFYVIEGGYTLHSAQTPGCQIGDYHVGFWGIAGGKDEGSQRGLYASASQLLVSKGDDSSESGLGVFVRAGWADGEGIEINEFWSVGLQYEGIASADGSDVLGIGWARGTFAPGAAADGFLGSETALELYYNLPLREWATISPSVQYVANPGGDAGSDAIVVGVRAQMLLH